MKKISFLLIVLLASRFVVAAPALAQSAKVKKYTGRLISLDMKDTDINNVLRIIAEVSNLNMNCITECPSGQVTYVTKDTPWDQALDEVLETHGLSSVLQGNVLKIYEKAKVPKKQKSFSDYKGRLISFDLKVTDFDSGLRIVAEVSRKNIIVVNEDLGDTAERPIRIIDVPWDQALDICAEMVGLEARYLPGNVIKLYKQNDPRLKRPRKKYSGQLISIDLQDTAVEKAFSIIEKVSGLKIKGQRPSGKITLRLIDVPWDQVLALVLEEFNYTASVEKSGIYINPELGSRSKRKK